MQVIDAAVWREEMAQKRDLMLAWNTAALMRRKKLPSIKALMAASTPAKPLHGKELAERQAEFSEMSRAVNLDKVIKRANDGSNPTRRGPDSDPGDAGST